MMSLKFEKIQIFNRKLIILIVKNPIYQFIKVSLEMIKQTEAFPQPQTFIENLIQKFKQAIQN